MNVTHRVIRPDDEPNHHIGAEALVRILYGHKILPATRRSLSPEWQLVAERVESSTGLDRDAKQADAFKLMNGLKGDRAAVGTAMSAALYDALGQANIVPPVDETDPDAPSIPLSFRAAILGARAFNSTIFKLQWLVKQILVMGQPCIVGAPKKSMKTTITCALAVSLASGEPFLGMFEVPEPVGVLILSGESGGATLQETLRRICRTMGVDLDDLEGRLFIGDQLPQLSNEDDMAELAGFIREAGVKLVIVDPLYLCMCASLPGGRRIDPANLFDVGPLLMSVTKACLNAGATPMLVHHFRKNAADPYKTPELDDLAYAGIQEYARQTLLFRRREEFVPGSGSHRLWMVAGGSVGFTNEYAIDISEGVIDDDFQGRYWEVQVKPASEARDETTGGKMDAKTQAIVDKAKERLNGAEVLKQERCQAIVQLLRDKGPQSKTAIREALNLNTEKVGPPLWSLSDSGIIERTMIQSPCGKGTREVEGYRLAPSGPKNTPGHRDNTGTTPGQPGYRTDTGTPGQHRDSPPLSKERGAAGCPGVRVFDGENEEGNNTSNHAGTEGGTC